MADTTKYNMEKGNTVAADVQIDEAELDAAKREADEKEEIYSYTHELKAPFEYEGESYTEIRFDWGRLTGNDSLKIENEMQATGMPVVIPSLSGGYLIRMAAKASGVAIDLLLALPIRDYNKIRSEARSFLLKAEL